MLKSYVTKTAPAEPVVRTAPKRGSPTKAQQRDVGQPSAQQPPAGKLRTLAPKVRKGPGL